MLIVEIILTIAAWGRGWKWLSLLPLGIAFGIGLIYGASGGNVEDMGAIVLVDVAAIIALIVMTIVRKPGTEPKVKDPDTK